MTHRTTLLMAARGRVRRAAVARHDGAPYRLSGQDVAIGWILAAMVAFGCAVGFVFPILVSPLVEVRAGEDAAFRLACVVAGLCVGGFAYGVARFTLFRANRRLAKLAAYDGLTGLFNQREFTNILDRELGRSVRSGNALSLLVIDLDHFKCINDGYGHLVGDQVLVAMAEVIRAVVRPGDEACRIGGEEFGVLLPDTGKEDATLIAERIRSHIERSQPHAVLRVTASIGAATYPDDAPTRLLLTRRSDDAMYAAKAAGRNAVCAWGSEISR